MPDFPGRLRTPRLPSAPSAPVPGEMYYDTGTSTLFWWDGSTWKSASGGGGTAEVNISTDGPSPRVAELLWVDTDSIAPTPVGTPSSVPPLVTSLPALPGDGQEVYYVADVTNGVLWHLRYRTASSSAYKWELVGGSDMLGETLTDQGFSSTTYADLGTIGPDVIVPLAGDYDVTIEATFYSSVTNANGLMSFVAPALVNTVTPMDVRSISFNPPSALTGVTASNRMRVRACAANDLLRAKYRLGAAATADFRDRRMYVRPVRVG